MRSVGNLHFRLGQIWGAAEFERVNLRLQRDPVAQLWSTLWVGSRIGSGVRQQWQRAVVGAAVRRNLVPHSWDLIAQ